MRLLRNRGQSWSGISKAVGAVTGRIWVSSTYGLVGRGLKPVTPDLLGDFAAVLDVPTAGLAAVIGMEVPETPHIRLGELLWAMRCLPRERLADLVVTAEAMITETGAKARVGPRVPPQRTDFTATMPTSES